MSLAELTSSWKNFINPTTFNCLSRNREFENRLKEIENLLGTEAEASLFVDADMVSALKLKRQGMLVLLKDANSPFTEKPWVAFADQTAGNVVKLPDGATYLELERVPLMFFRLLRHGLKGHFQADDVIARLHLLDQGKIISCHLYDGETHTPLAFFISDPWYLNRRHLQNITLPIPA